DSPFHPSGHGAQVHDSSLTIRAELPSDQADVRVLHLLAFGQPQEADPVDHLRAEGFARLSLVAEQAGQLLGHILFSPVKIMAEQRTEQGLALAPVPVLPDQQRSGIGSALIRAGLELAEQSGDRFVLVLGEPGYY